MAKKATSNLRSRTTRSSRGRLVTSTSENPNEQLTTQLSLLGLYAAQTIGDGNCLFRALADQVHGSAVLHGQVRQQICDWIEAHGERYEGFVEEEGGEESDGRRRGRGGKEKTKTKTKGGESEGGPSKRLQAYLRGMRENATYGGHMELSAFAHMTRRNIKVVQPGLVYVIEWRAGEGSSSSSASTSANATTSSTTTSSAATSSTQNPPSTPSKPKSTSTAPPSTSAPAPSSTQAQAPSSSSQPTSSTPLPSQVQPQPPSTPERRRSTRTPSVGGLTPKKHLQTPVQQGKKPKKVVVDEGGEVQKVKTGRHGYYVYEEVTSDEEEGGEGVGEERVKEEVGRTQTQTEDQNQDQNQTQAEVQSEVKTEERMEEDVEEMEEKEVEELVVRKEEEDAGPTIYVAYHDWEHFSSIRNLRGPHTGLPQVQETPAQTVDVPSTAEIEREATKEREREKKRERERKEKERKERAQIKAKEKAGKATAKEGSLKVKLRLPTQTPTTSAPATPPGTTPAPAAVEEGGRSASPFPPGPATPTKHGLAAPVSTASTSMSVSTPPHSSSSPPSSIASSAEREKEIQLRAHAARMQGAGLGTDRSAYRSPKRTFDESSASGGEEGVGGSGSGSGREEKRSRTRVVEIVGAETKRGPEDMDVDVDGDTPGLSAPGTSSSSESSEVTSEAEGSSPSASPEPPAPTPKTRFQHQHHVAAGEKQLTRRQRKALGLPKPRAGTVSAGKIVIPGGRWTGKTPPQSVSVAGGGVPKGTEEEAEEEWRRNGTGRLDVRGFRELKI